MTGAPKDVANRFPTLLDTTDTEFRHPYVDVDEERQEPHAHRYVHGGFTGTETRFSLYLPPAERYQGRVFQHITPVPGSEHLAPTETGERDKIGAAFAGGASFLETNGGGVPAGPASAADSTIGAWRANAACAAYARVVMGAVYGPHRTYVYAYGGSGGAFRTIGGAENTDGVWDGVVPYVVGSPMALPNVFSVRMHALRLLRDKLDGIVDAVEPGSGRGPYDGLNDEEATALREVTRMGFPLRSWFAHRSVGLHGFGAILPGLSAVDPGYFEDFWTTDGYLGADPSSSVHRDRVRRILQVVRPLTRSELGRGDAAPDGAPRGGVDQAFRGPDGDRETVVALRVAPPLDRPLLGARLRVVSGDASGHGCTVERAEGDLVTIADPDTARALQGVAPGDLVELDNSDFLAAQTYHRHQVPDAEFAVWDQFRDADGAPLFPQRPVLVGPMFAAGASGTVQSGRFAGKMIVVASMLDREAYPWQADWYRTKVAEYLGVRTDDSFRLWFTDNAVHADDESDDPVHVVSYLGTLDVALRQLAAWVESGIPAAPTSRYTVRDGQVDLSGDAERGGVQPVVTLRADGRERADVAPGQVVTMRVEARSTAEDLQIVDVRLDVDGDGSFAVSLPVEPSSSVDLDHSQVFLVPGTYFVTARVSARPASDAGRPFARIDNLARVRVVVGQ